MTACWQLSARLTVFTFIFLHTNSSIMLDNSSTITQVKFRKAIGWLSVFSQCSASRCKVVLKSSFSLFPYQFLISWMPCYAFPIIVMSSLLLYFFSKLLWYVLHEVRGFWKQSLHSRGRSKVYVQTTLPWPHLEITLGMLLLLSNMCKGSAAWNNICCFFLFLVEY